MIHLFNRAELLLTYDLNRLNQVRDALAAAGIDCQCRTKDPSSPTAFSARGQRGTLGLNREFMVEYKLYVRREDLSRARSLL